MLGAKLFVCMYGEGELEGMRVRNQATSYLDEFNPNPRSVSELEQVCSHALTHSTVLPSVAAWLGCDAGHGINRLLYAEHGHKGFFKIQR